MSKDSKVTVVKRFVVAKGKYGEGLKLRFTNKKGETFDYDHDAVLDSARDHLKSLNCWKVYKNYTSSSNIPGFARNLATKVE